MENGVDMEDNTKRSAHIIKGLNRGVLLFANELLDIPTQLPLT